MIDNNSKQAIANDDLRRVGPQTSCESSLDGHADLTDLLIMTNIGPQASLKNGDL